MNCYVTKNLHACLERSLILDIDFNHWETMISSKVKKAKVPSYTNNLLFVFYLRIYTPTYSLLSLKNDHYTRKYMENRPLFLKISTSARILSILLYFNASTQATQDIMAKAIFTQFLLAFFPEIPLLHALCNASHPVYHLETYQKRKRAAGNSRLS